ncbi:cyclic lactone autoinducer peptide [Paenibacillus radicibacter]|nr:cyclic lactone autoinducer peptide [Paenibacillus radicibacter]
MKSNVLKSMGKLALRGGEVQMETSCALFNYEPKIPVELLNQKSE